ncbi:MAG: TIGR02281 family clan AA aspartic protease [Gallionellaceae bacterium]|jgi:clan AA aspartic protease (TIGR02281 family)
MQRLHIAYFMLALLFVPSAVAATIFKCINAAGTSLYQEKPCKDESRSVSTLNISSDAIVDENGASVAGPLVLSQGRNGHYFVDGAINDQFLNFVVDTGASSVVVPQSIAFNSGLHCITQVSMQTGNGTSNACTTVIQKLRFGNFTLTNVEAIIAPNLSQPLLGMNVLKRFRVEQDNGQLRLSKKY